MAVNLTGFYLHVVADVIDNVRADFVHEGIDQTVLTELQSLWELNMMQSGAIQGPLVGETMYPRNDVSGGPVHDLNVAYGGETPSAELIFATPVQTPLSCAQTPLPQYTGPGPSPNYQTEPFEVPLRRPSPYTHASSWVDHKLEAGLEMNSEIDMNIAHDGGNDEHPLNPQYLGAQEILSSTTGKRKREEVTTNFQSGDYLPQIDGAADLSTSLERASTNFQGLVFTNARVKSRKNRNECSTRVKINCDTSVQALANSAQYTPGGYIPQMDGIGDHYDDDVAEEDYNEPGDEEQFSLHEPTKQEEADPDILEPPLNEDDDLADDLDDIDQAEGDAKTENIVLAQFEKVTRSKNKWKCILKDGIMRLRNQDYLFSRATGEFEF